MLNAHKAFIRVMNAHKAFIREKDVQQEPPLRKGGTASIASQGGSSTPSGGRFVNCPYEGPFFAV